MEKNEIFTKNHLYIFFINCWVFNRIYTVRETFELVVVIEKKEIEKFENLKEDKIKQIPISFYFEKKKLFDR